MSAHMDQLIAQFESFRGKIRQAEANFAGVADMQEQIAEIESSATSPDGNVRVVAGAGGAVTDLKLGAAALRMDADQLARTIMNTMRQAVAGAVQRQAGIVDDAFGDSLGVNTSEQVRQAQAEAFGTAEAEPASQEQQQPQQPQQSSQPQQSQPQQQAAPPRRRPTRSDDDNDDYFDQGSIMRR
ncbi:YbaB/EbfC family nucleoid-associated protein [Prauserella cavernicola]|uniref:YbaB/EbfC family nucleoid-associated protein n=1 Tax=Prauserella cavernicola TaxID=2800127 RepID=A0A934QRU0_9PSEU|nr:YbaB/EbfC family nucleoid-associated protein [Prauserella cavernicola]MBK1785041.1 YbaB/EbfC family nucleoid-associated protein [Prauserella cavernicola]